MNQSMLILLSPLAFLFSAILTWLKPSLGAHWIKKAMNIATIISLITAVTSGFFVYRMGLIETPTWGYKGLGFSLRLDAISVLMFIMIALLSFIIVKFSNNYLDGDPKQGVFMGRLGATIAAVQVLVLSGNLGILTLSWILTSVSLHSLLTFYNERAGAQIAARKKAFVARLSDISIILAAALLYTAFGTGNYEVIFEGVKNSISANLLQTDVQYAAVFLALAALFKSAQFPTHGWLIEVMETPTPVSALLHAGLLNAGPFLIIRMSFIMEINANANTLLIIVGAFTALFGSVVYLTQTSIKTALGYSSIAHMGFSLFVCGLGLYPAAMLHLVAHSFYKAHSFLSSGSVIEVLKAGKVKPTSKPHLAIWSVLLGLAVYTSFAFAWGIDPQKEFTLLALGAVISMGVSRIFASALNAKSSKLFLQGCLLSVIVTAAFFTLESGSSYLLSKQLPPLSIPSLNRTILVSAILLIFSITVILQMIAPSFKSKSRFNNIAIHVRNGFYMNALFDRAIRSLYIQEAKIEIDETSEWKANSHSPSAISNKHWQTQSV